MEYMLQFNEPFVKLQDFILLLARSSGLLLTAPIFYATTLNVQLRVAFAAVITLFVQAYIVPEPLNIDVLSHRGFMVLIQEMAFGLCMGFLLQMMFAVMLMAGDQIGNSAGLGFAQMVDPQSGTSVPVVSQLFSIMMSIMFLTLGAHLVLFEFLFETYRNFPPGQLFMETLTFRHVAGYGSFMFMTAFMIMAPVGLIIFMMNITMGVLTRAAPQMNIFSVGFPANIAIAFIMLYFATPSIVLGGQKLIYTGFNEIKKILIAPSDLPTDVRKIELNR